MRESWYSTRRGIARALGHRFFLCTRCVLVGAYDGAVDEYLLEIGVVSQLSEDLMPNAST
jgi:hypothetical protein